MLKRPLCLLPLARMAVVCLSLSIVFPVHAQTAEHTADSPAEKLPAWDVVSVHYDVKLKWSPNDGPLQSNGSDATDTGESIFTAVQEQLGLKLVPSKGPMLTFVVDHIEKPKDD